MKFYQPNKFSSPLATSQVIWPMLTQMQVVGTGFIACLTNMDVQRFHGLSCPATMTGWNGLNGMVVWWLFGCSLCTLLLLLLLLLDCCCWIVSFNLRVNWERLEFNHARTNNDAHQATSNQI